MNYQRSIEEKQMAKYAEGKVPRVKKEAPKVFIYDNLMTELPLNFILKLHNAPYLGSAVTEKAYKMYARGKNCLVVDNEDPVCRIKGEVFQLNTQSALKELDALYIELKDMRRVEIITPYDKAWMYCVEHDLEEDLDPVLRIIRNGDYRFYLKNADKIAKEEKERKKVAKKVDVGFDWKPPAIKKRAAPVGWQVANQLNVVNYAGVFEELMPKVVPPAIPPLEHWEVIGGHSVGFTLDWHRRNRDPRIPRALHLTISEHLQEITPNLDAISMAGGGLEGRKWAGEYVNEVGDRREYKLEFITLINKAVEGIAGQYGFTVKSHNGIPLD